MRHFARSVALSCLLLTAPLRVACADSLAVAAPGEGTVTMTHYSYDTGQHVADGTWTIPDTLGWERLTVVLKRLPVLPKNFLSAKAFGKDEMVMVTHKNLMGEGVSDIRFFPGYVVVTSYERSYEYFKDEHSFEEFLRGERQRWAAYKAPSKEEIAKTKGILVSYRLYANDDNNPVWMITKSSDVDRYKSFFYQLPLLEDTGLLEAVKPRFEELGSFNLYPNLPGEDFPTHVTVAQGIIRTSALNAETTIYFDSHGFFSFFRQQAKRLGADKKATVALPSTP